MQKLSESTITSQMQRELNSLIETKIVHILGGRKSKANSVFLMRFNVAVELLRSLKEQYNITVYSEIKVKDFNEVKEYILAWRVPYNLELKIKEINTSNIDNKYFDRF